MKTKSKSFKCTGCGKAATKKFTWTHSKTGKKSHYCAKCDGLLIADQPLPKHNRPAP